MKIFYGSHTSNLTFAWLIDDSEVVSLLVQSLLYVHHTSSHLSARLLHGTTCEAFLSTLPKFIQENSPLHPQAQLLTPLTSTELLQIYTNVRAELGPI